MRIFKKLYIVITGISALLPLHSCFTGVEGTKKITLSRKELSSVAPTEEELLLADVTYQPVGQWKKGRLFYITDDKVNVVLATGGSEELKKGDIIEYEGTVERISPDGHNKTYLIFGKEGNEYRLPVEKSYQETLVEYDSSFLPMMIDLSLLENIKAKLVGKLMWTRTPLWYNEELKYKAGRKYIPVEITAVETGDNFFPVKIEFRDDKGELSYLLMNIGNGGNETRGFARLFMLNDPRRLYKTISDENWEAIQKGELRIGMTKEECRLSIGNPSDTNIGHDYSRQLEIWNYPDGSYVHFVDDLVVSFRKTS